MQARAAGGSGAHALQLPHAGCGLRAAGRCRAADPRPCPAGRHGHGARADAAGVGIPFHSVSGAREPAAAAWVAWPHCSVPPRIMSGVPARPAAMECRALLPHACMRAAACPAPLLPAHRPATLQGAGGTGRADHVCVSGRLPRPAGCVDPLFSAGGSGAAQCRWAAPACRGACAGLRAPQVRAPTAASPDSRLAAAGDIYLISHQGMGVAGAAIATAGAQVPVRGPLPCLGIHARHMHGSIAFG